MSRSKFLLFGLIITALLFGNFQEYIKVGVNAVLKFGDKYPGFYELSPDEKKDFMAENNLKVDYNYAQSIKPASFLYSFSRNQLIAFKWFMALIFAFLHFLFCFAILKQFSGNFKGNLIALYIIGILVSVSLFGLGKVSGLDLYGISRKILGFLQTILPAAVLYLFSKVQNTHINSKDEG